MNMNETKPTGKDYVGSDGLYADVQRTMQLAAEMTTGWHADAIGLGTKKYTIINIDK